MFNNTRVIFFIFLFTGCIRATIITRTEADRGRISLNSRNYHLKLQEVQDKYFTMYDISENFLASDEGGSGEPAVLKVVLHYRDQSIKRNIEEEIRFSDAVGLHLFSKVDDEAFYIVMRNVRMPLKVSPLKPYHEWYLEDPTREINMDLKKMRDSVEAKLISYASEHWRLCHGDPHLLNIYVDEALEIVMPINWAPPGAQFNEWGVIENCSVEGPEGGIYIEEPERREYIMLIREVRYAGRKIDEVIGMAQE